MNIAALGWYETGPNTAFLQKAHSVRRHPFISLLLGDTSEQENPSTLLSGKCLCSKATCDAPNWKILGGKYPIFDFLTLPLPPPPFFFTATLY